MTTEPLRNELQEAFVSYVTQAKRIFASERRPKQERPNDSLKLVYTAPVYGLGRVITKLESSPTFEKLCLALEGVLQGSGLNPSGAKQALQDFFRRSHLYIDLDDKHNADTDHFFALLWSSLFSQKVKTTRLSLIEDVSFESKALDFGLFKICKYTSAELDNLIDNRTREIFYPQSRIDVGILSRFWFIVEDAFTETSHFPQINTTDGAETEYEASRQLNSDATQRGFPERLVQLLSLYGWPDFGTVVTVKGEQITDSWKNFSVPYSLVFDDNILTEPHSVNGIPNSVLRVIDEMKWTELSLEEWKQEFPDDDDDNPEWYPPPRYDFSVKLSSKEESSLKTIVKKGEAILKIVEHVEEWSFVEIALGYLGKAFVTPEGLDQILWHCGVLEALLSEEVAVRQTILRRLAAIYPKAKQAGKRFDAIYKFRNQLAHGKKYTTKATTHHLNDARELARETLIWFINYLLRVDQMLRKEDIRYEHYPRRDELVAVLDFDTPALKRLGLLIRNLPEGVPIDNAK